MGFLDDAASVVSGRTSHSKHHHHHHKTKSSTHGHRSRSRSRSRSRPRSLPASVLGLGSDVGGHKEHRHHGPGGDEDRHREGKKRGASASFFSFGLGSGHGRPPSYYKRSPRTSFLRRTLKKIRKLLGELARYAKKHPLRVFTLVIVPLVTTGALGALLARFGLRLPRGLEAMLGLAARASAGHGAGLVGEAVRLASGGLAGASAGHSHATVERGRQGDLRWERRRLERDDYDGWGEGGGTWGAGLAKGMANIFR